MITCKACARFHSKTSQKPRYGSNLTNVNRNGRKITFLKVRNERVIL